jgi:hypothetical protein
MNNERTYEIFKAFTATECSEVSSDQPYEDGVVIQRLKTLCLQQQGWCVEWHDCTAICIHSWLSELRVLVNKWPQTKSAKVRRLDIAVLIQNHGQGTELLERATGTCAVVPIITWTLMMEAETVSETLDYISFLTVVIARGDLTADTQRKQE